MISLNGVYQYPYEYRNEYRMSSGMIVARHSTHSEWYYYPHVVYLDTVQSMCVEYQIRACIPTTKGLYLVGSH